MQLILYTYTIDIEYKYIWYIIYNINIIFMWSILWSTVVWTEEKEGWERERETESGEERGKGGREREDRNLL